MKEKTMTSMRSTLLYLAVAGAMALGALFAGTVQPVRAWADDAAQSAVQAAV